MRSFWQSFRTTPLGRTLRGFVHFAYYLRELVILQGKQFNRKRLRAEKTYQYWKKARCLQHVIKQERELLLKAREQQERLYQAVDDTPLVSVVIPTWNRAEILVRRTLPSVFMQTYKNIEIVIVGDCCTDNTVELIESIADPRIHFINLSERGNYPEDRIARWQVAGSVPKNKALDLCQGSWIAPLDDDDLFTPNHIEVLLRQAQSNNLELVYGKVKMEKYPDRWIEKGDVTHLMSIQNSSMLFRSYIKLFRSDINAWRIGLAGDVQRTIRYRETGVRIGYLDEIVAVIPLRPRQTQKRYNAEDRPDNRVLNI